MNNVLSLLQTAHQLPDPHPALYSEHMITELLSLHGDMIEQLRLERLGSPGNADFLTLLIEQHEKTMLELRAKLENTRAETNGAPLPKPPVRSAPAQPHFRCLYFAAASLTALQVGIAPHLIKSPSAQS
ncbi:MAG: hypothetical protein Q8N18_13265 [Opitutaceae bacterium]|nr:hypothetical protein [Opitutaceae bacterium]